jgi:glutaredoxin
VKSFLSLIIVVGLLAAGWVNQEKLSGLLTKLSAPTEDAAEESSATSQRVAATPHPAREAQAKATSLYPGIAVPNSAMNKKFVELYKDAQASNPALLSRPDWPLQLADRAIVSLGGKPLPRTATAPARAAKQVVIFTTAECPYCKQAKQYFAHKGIPYREINIDMPGTGAQEYRKYGGTGSVPLIVVGDKTVHGFSAEELDRLL